MWPCRYLPWDRTIALFRLALSLRMTMQLARSLATLAVAVSLATCSGPAPADSAPAPSASSPVAAAGPAASASASPTATGTAADGIEQLLARAMDAPIDPSGPETALQGTEQAMKDDMRRAIGIAGLLGRNGSATLAGIDTAERETVAALVVEMGAQAARTGGTAVVIEEALRGTTPPGARLASAVTRAGAGNVSVHPSDPLENLTGVFMVALDAPNAFAGLERGVNGNLDAPAVTEDRTTTRGESVHTTRLVTLIGSKLTFELRMTIGTAGPPAYSEETSGKVTVDLCPDENGVVALELSLGSRSSLFGGGMQYKVDLTATGHADDNGQLTDIDLGVDGSLATQPLTGNGALGTEPMFLETGFEQSIDMVGGSTTPTTHTIARTRYSSHVDGRFAEIAVSLIMLGRKAAVAALHRAEQKWTTGYCLAITVPEVTGSSRQVDPGSVTPFTAVVKHKFETAELRVPVTATLASGAVSVTPSGTKVPAPAAFRYKAPGDLDKTATVNLETRSKRGIATLTVEFRTGLAAYRASWEDQGTVWSGIVCGLDRPFTITVVTPGGDLTMPFAFAPSSPAGGTVTFDVTKYGTHWTGSGPYAVKATGTGQLSLVGQIRGSYTASGQTGYYPIAFNVPLTPLTTNECGTR